MRFRDVSAGFRLCQPVRVPVGADVVLTFCNAYAGTSPKKKERFAELVGLRANLEAVAAVNGKNKTVLPRIKP
jgi:hypothetical protein